MERGSWFGRTQKAGTVYIESGPWTDSWQQLSWSGSSQTRQIIWHLSYLRSFIQGVGDIEGSCKRFPAGKGVHSPFGWMRWRPPTLERGMGELKIEITTLPDHLQKLIPFDSSRWHLSNGIQFVKIRDKLLLYRELPAHRQLLCGISHSVTFLTEDRWQRQLAGQHPRTKDHIELLKSQPLTS